jgi:WD domain, G-beta repeat
MSPDGRLLATGMHGPNSAVRIIEILTGKETLLLKGHAGSVAAMAWSPDRLLVASGDQNNYERPTIAQTVQLWDAASGKEISQFGSIHADIAVLRFSRDGKSLFAGLGDGSILIFRVPKLTLAALREETVAACWTAISDDDAGKAYRALGALVTAPKQSVPFLRDHLKPVALADPAKIQKWISDLDSDKFNIRQTAAKELTRLGDQVQEPIKTALKVNISLETRRRLEQILKSLSDVSGSETVRTIRAIMVLERIGSPDAQTVLEALAGGAPGARETEEAKASLERLKLRGSKLP